MAHPNDTPPPVDRAAVLLALHRGPRPLVLPNAWDASSARVLAEAGFPAIATTSGGVARAMGFEDGERAPREEMLRAAQRIIGAVEIPTTVDFEAGYGFDPPELVARLQAIGAAGCNLEDTDHRAGGLVPQERQAAHIAEVRSAIVASGRGLVVNARVDVFRPVLGLGERALEEGIERATAYLAAGADCVYPIFLADEPSIGEFVRRVPGPVNILARSGTPSIARLAELGVRRITFGGGIHHLTLDYLRALAEQIRRGDDAYASS